MRVLLVGCGALGGAIARAAARMEGVRLAVYDVDEPRARALAQEVGALRPDVLDMGLAEADVVVEAASQAALREVAPRALGRGLTVVALSVGALADDAFRADVERLCRQHGGRLLVTSG
ncbi:MAG TPA: aspartate dehydrogenase, partial [Candidatus Thermoplasmatota archaeon]|nr:aspartate dehydrogenase [Candidatus Thermoplasmatota archaeon]